MAAVVVVQYGAAFWQRYKGKEKSEYTWSLFDHSRCVGRAWFGELGALVVDTNAAARLRPDEHPGLRNKGVKGPDCLHFDVPGIADTFTDLLFSVLRSADSYRQRAAELGAVLGSPEGASATGAVRHG